MACQLQNFDLVSALTDSEETFVDIEDIKGNTPLHYAVVGGSLKII
jgi:ankyrin repeat protein